PPGAGAGIPCAGQLVRQQGVYEPGGEFLCSLEGAEFLEIWQVVSLFGIATFPDQTLRHGETLWEFDISSALLAALHFGTQHNVKFRAVDLLVADDEDQVDEITKSMGHAAITARVTLDHGANLVGNMIDDRIQPDLGPVIDA